ncbi:aminoglycoside phosphotransferase family protein [Actinoplanes sp. NBC_00393]|uniref:phosphotransferase n=1 Tax=Actinoplanes sp. NBC_00393 TaxID=2975953 RepID=UPI002E1AA7C0
MANPEPLRGGFIADAVRVGDTVRKTPPADPAFVRGLLRHFEAHGWAGAPRHLGTDTDGRDVLTFVEGDVPWQGGPPPEYVRSPASLAAVARLVREFHDLTAGTPLAGGQDVVCHNDLSPKNTVYRAGMPVALIDWDIASPGPRVHDVAHVCWQYIGLGPAITDPGEALRLVRVVADAYGLPPGEPLLETIAWWQDRCWRGILAGADAGDPAMIRLRDLGAADEVRAAHRWSSENLRRDRPALG